MHGWDLIGHLAGSGSHVLGSLADLERSAVNSPPVQGPAAESPADRRLSGERSSSGEKSAAESLGEMFPPVLEQQGRFSSSTL